MISNSNLQTNNRCRLHLNVLSVVNIESGNGLELDVNFWFGKIENEEQ